jgi:hypothetical protein
MPNAQNPFASILNELARQGAEPAARQAPPGAARREQEVRTLVVREGEEEMVMVPRRILNGEAQLALPSAAQIMPYSLASQNTLLDQLLALAGGDDMDTRDMVTVMSVAAIIIMSMVMLFQSMSTTLLLKRLM